MSRGFKSQGSSEETKRGIPVFGVDIGVSMVKGMFFVSQRGAEPEAPPIYEGQVLDLVILEQISCSEEQEHRIRSSEQGAKKTLRAAVLARWPVRTDAGVGISEWTPATLTLRASAQGILICALRCVRKEADGNDAGIAFRVSTAKAPKKTVGAGASKATIIDANACGYTVLPSDPEISDDVGERAAEWYRAVRLLRDGGGETDAPSGGSSSGASDSPPPWDDADIPF